MEQKHVVRITIDDFVKGDFTLKKPEKTPILGSSAIIKVVKTDKGVTISSPFDEENAFIKNFSITLIPPNEQEGTYINNKFICTFNWSPVKNVTQYRLFKNNILEKNSFNNNFKYNFSEYENGTYIFRVDCLEPNIFIKEAKNSNQYTCPFLKVPIFLNYKYYFYYYIENKDKDVFSKKILSVLPIDARASKSIADNKNQSIENKDCCFQEHSFSPLENKEVYRSDEYIYFTENTYSLENQPPDYFLLKLLKKPGSRNQLQPDVKYIDVYIEKIKENDENLNQDFEGGV